MLAAICATRRCLAVAGTHGKTTTASMLSLILVEAGLRPSFLIGADVNEIGTNAVWDTGEWLVVEADESYGTFQAISPDLAVLTNVEPDHLDYYGTFDALRAAFADLPGRAGRGAVVCSDDPEAAAIGREHGAITVGTAPGSTYVIGDLDLHRSSVSFSLGGPEGALGILDIGVPGLHNARNAAARCGGGPPGRRPLRGGAGRARPLRRCDAPLRVPRRGDGRHLRRRLRAPPDRGAGRPGDRAERRLVAVVAVFQPHRFSRTAALATQFGTAFADADVLVVTDVYSAGERPVPESRAAWWPTRSGRRIRGCP